MHAATGHWLFALPLVENVGELREELTHLDRDSLDRDVWMLMGEQWNPERCDPQALVGETSCRPFSIGAEPSSTLGRKTCCHRDQSE